MRSLVEQHQRNSLMKGLTKAEDNDLIILSDVDEIPDLKKLMNLIKENMLSFHKKCLCTS